MADENQDESEAVDGLAGGSDIEESTEEESSASTSSPARRYPPLFSIIAGGLIAILALPSSLNVPQTNPTQVLEFAPVPPEDSDDPPPPPGNFDQLGLGESSNFDGGDGAAGGDGPGAGGVTTLPPPLQQGTGDTPTGFRCVPDADGVVRQTEDPLSPPCVPFFEGDNFGATYQGVTADEIKILMYFDGGITTVGTSRGEETCPTTKVVDLINDPPDDEECHVIRQARIWQTYFNDRYQTYGRYVHFHLYFGTSASSTSPETRRADAAESFRLVEPFATLDYSAFSGGGDSFVDTMARRGVLNFGQFAGQKAEFFIRYPKLIWGYQPSQEIQVLHYSAVLCNYYVGRPVTHSPQNTGEPRKFGLVYTTDNGYTALQEFKDQVVAKFKDCGGDIAVTGTHPVAGYSVDSETSPRYATEVMQKMKAAGVTTIIWPGGMEVNYTAAAKNLDYYPEWIVAGDGDMENEFAQQGYRGSMGQDQDVWDHAVVVSNQPQTPAAAGDQICFQAQRSVDPDTPQQDAARTGCDQYANLRQLFIGIQVAGPRLGPTSIDRGFHAIPAVESPSLQIPSCYYLPNDYTCIKDFIIGDWDPKAGGENDTTPGCYRMVGSYRRITENLQPQDPLEGYDPSVDECQGYGGSLRLNLGAPDPTRL